MMKVAVLGLGRLGSVLAKRLHEQGYPLQISDPNASQHQAFEGLKGVDIFVDSFEAVQDVACVIVAVKPQYVKSLAESIAPHLGEETVVISMAAGVNLDALRGWFPDKTVLRAMPNLASGVGAGTTALMGDAPESVTNMLKTFGHVLPLDEAQVHAFTGAVGSGPAFLCRIVDNAAHQLQRYWPDIPEQDMQKWLLSMISGTVEVLTQKGLTPKALEASVAAPNGTTLAGLEAGQGEVFDLAKAIVAAAERSEEIAKEIEN